VRSTSGQKKARVYKTNLIINLIFFFNKIETANKVSGYKQLATAAKQHEELCSYANVVEHKVTQSEQFDTKPTIYR